MRLNLQVGCQISLLVVLVAPADGRTAAPQLSGRNQRGDKGCAAHGRVSQRAPMQLPLNSKLKTQNSALLTFPLDRFALCI
jgi:hypothetical protein